jgi:hypothetical protein
VLLSAVYVAFQRVLQLLPLLFRSTELRELEIVVLRQRSGRAAPSGNDTANVNDLCQHAMLTMPVFVQ